MRKIKLYIATSLDNYIARPNGEIDWLETFPTPEGEDFGYAAFMETVTTTLMGNKTYQQVLGFDMPFPYADKENFVFTRQKGLEPTEHVQFVSENIISFIQSLKEKPGKNIWLIGGGQLNTVLLNHDLIDEMILTVLPIVLGEGIPLFGGKPEEQIFNLLNHQVFDNGFVQLTYQRKDA